MYTRSTRLAVAPICRALLAEYARTIPLQYPEYACKIPLQSLGMALPLRCLFSSAHTRVVLYGATLRAVVYAVHACSGDWDCTAWHRPGMGMAQARHGHGTGPAWAWHRPGRTSSPSSGRSVREPNSLKKSPTDTGASSANSACARAAVQACNRQRDKYSVQCATYTVQYTACNVQRAPCNIRRATYSVQRAAHIIQQTSNDGSECQQRLHARLWHITL